MVVLCICTRINCPTRTATAKSAFKIHFICMNLNTIGFIGLYSEAPYYNIRQFLKGIEFSIKHYASRCASAVGRIKSFCQRIKLFSNNQNKRVTVVREEKDHITSNINIQLYYGRQKLLENNNNIDLYNCLAYTSICTMERDRLNVRDLYIYTHLGNFGYVIKQNQI